jgi:hypothetical protein
MKGMVWNSVSSYPHIVRLWWHSIVMLPSKWYGILSATSYICQKLVVKTFPLVSDGCTCPTLTLWMVAWCVCLQGSNCKGALLQYNQQWQQVAADTVFMFVCKNKMWTQTPPTINNAKVESLINAVMASSFWCSEWLSWEECNAANNCVPHGWLWWQDCQYLELLCYHGSRL